LESKVTGSRHEGKQQKLKDRLTVDWGISPNCQLTGMQAKESFVKTPMDG
jgi:hypothetical protein